MASYYNENTVLYLDGAFVKASEAKVDLYGQSLHYGYAVFEGIRSYKTVSGETKGNTTLNSPRATGFSCSRLEMAGKNG